MPPLTLPMGRIFFLLIFFSMVNGQLSITIFVVGEPIHYSPLTIHDAHSVLKLFTGFAMAALIAWKLIVIIAIIIAIQPASTNIHQLISTL